MTRSLENEARFAILPRRSNEPGVGFPVRNEGGFTGGSSLVPAICAIFDRRFGVERIASGGEFTSIDHGLALIGEEPDVAAWAA